jgi:pilus assembly protein CpaC
MLASSGSKKSFAAGAIAAIIALSMVCMAYASDLPASETQSVKQLNLLVGKSMVLKSKDAVKRISIADPDVADFVLISPKEIYLTGKSAGITNMTLWHAKGNYQIFDLDVGFDVSQLKQQLNDILPEESDLRVTATHASITLSGRVSNAANLSQALSLARSYAPEGNVNNLVEVRGVQQVMLEVRVAEMQRSTARSLGVNFNYLTESGKFGISQLGGLTNLVSPDEANIGVPGLVDVGSGFVSAPFGTLVSPAANAILRFGSNGTTWTAFVDALKADGLVKVLAEPTLIALSGESANFLAGGEFPVPVPQGLGTVAIEYKTFGVGLTFTPTVLADNKINIKVAPEVSELDFGSGIQFSGVTIPGLNTRKAETVVELADGQSFAIAGLLRDTARDAISKYPLLGDIPILGTLFRSRSFQKSETELIIIATPHLVKPIDADQQPLPTDYYIEPNDTEFYVLGLMEGRQSKTQTGNIQGELDGEFGHATP